MTFTAADANNLHLPRTADVVIANQFLHHVENLEGLTAWLAQTLAPMAQWSIAQAKFQRPVGPGQTLTFVLGEVRAGLWELQVRSASRLVASGSLRQHEEGAP